MRQIFSRSGRLFPNGRARALTAAGTAVLAVGLMGTNSAPSSAFDGPNGHHQFLQIVAKGAPLWGATMDLIDADGNLVYHWEVGRSSPKSGGKETWWYTANPGDTLKLYIATGSGVGLLDISDEWEVYAGQPDGDCWLIDPFGGISYTGDSDQGCTPD